VASNQALYAAGALNELRARFGQLHDPGRDGHCDESQELMLAKLRGASSESDLAGREEALHGAIWSSAHPNSVEVKRQDLLLGKSAFEAESVADEPDFADARPKFAEADFLANALCKGGQTTAPAGDVDAFMVPESGVLNQQELREAPWTQIVWSLSQGD
jgi:hypothetical protein